jgi:hypothetical protein
MRTMENDDENMLTLLRSLVGLPLGLAGSFVNGLSTSEPEFDDVDDRRMASMTPVPPDWEGRRAGSWTSLPR